LPVDQAEGSSVRKAFSEAVHGRAPSAVEAYWQRQIFSGRGVPPLQKMSDDEVIAYVRSNPSAVGYVSRGASLGNGVHAVQIVR
jgi:ABC-type phosphate transport system substrate-binding protein